MTRLITQDQIPDTILEAMTQEVAEAIKNKEHLDGLSLRVFDDYSNCSYLFYIVKNKLNKLEEVYFVSNDIVMDYRVKKSKFPIFQVF